MKNLCLLLFFLTLSFALAAQLSPKQSLVPPTDLFQVVQNRSVVPKTLKAEISDYDLLEVSAEAYAGLREAQHGNWSLSLPPTYFASEGLTLHLRPRPLTRSDFRLRLGSNDQVVTGVDLGQHFVGEVDGEPESRVALSLLDHELTATITRPDGSRLALGRIRKREKGTAKDHYVLFPDRQLLERQELDCATPDSGVPYSAKELTPATEGKSNGGCVDVYFEIDHDIVQDKGSVNAAAQHLAANFNESAILYDAIGVNLKISEIRVWDVPSPYSGNSSTALLTQFQSARTQFNGDLAQLVSYQASGGVAVLDGLCHPFVAARMSFASIRSNFQAVPIYSWSTMVISHELGHLMGSQHTHACVWNGNDTAIDGCPGWTEGFCGTPGLPTEGGTIMSYCHLTAVGINFNIGFGPQPTAVIANRVAAAQGCVQAVCSDDGGNNGGGGNGGNGDNGGNGNGDPDDEGDGSAPSVTCEQQTVFINLTLDDFGMETTWELRAESGGVLASGGPYPKKQKGRIMRDTICVPDGCYNFVIMDDDYDGICCAYGAGRYELMDTLGTMLGAGGEFDTLDIIDFCLPDLPDNDDDDEDCVALDFNELQPVSYGTNQDVGSVTVLENGNTIMLKDNAWKAVAMPYAITEQTWVSFWFRSTKLGEVHGIGFDDNEVISPNLTFQLYGTQSWGMQDFNDYSGDGSWKFYQIPVGQFYTGDAAYLFFTADHDVGTKDGNSYFRGVTISEGAPCGGNQLPVILNTPTSGHLQLVPNPANEQLTIGIDETLNNGKFQVMDLAGRTLLAGQLDGNQTVVNTVNLPAGTYVIRCENGVRAYTRRFAVVH